jgi:hypothetical protein
MTDIVARLRAWAAIRLQDPSEDLVIEAADEIEKLRALLKECADELADQVEGQYAKTKDHPAMKRRYDRDMQLVRDARAALEGQRGLENREAPK